MLAPLGARGCLVPNVKILVSDVARGKNRTSGDPTNGDYDRGHVDTARNVYCNS